jgi:hypothetical protein
VKKETLKFDLDFCKKKMYLHRTLIETGSTNLYNNPFKQLTTRVFFFFMPVHFFSRQYPTNGNFMSDWVYEPGKKMNTLLCND